MPDRKESLSDPNVANIGALYREIKVSRPDFEEEQGLVRPKLNWYVKFCKDLHRQYPSLGAGAKYDKKFGDAIAFLQWDLKAEEFSAAVKFVMLVSVVAALLIGTVLYFTLGEMLGELTGMPMMIPIYVFGIPVMIALVLYYFMQNYPLSSAHREQVRSLTYISEIVGYLIMSIKLVPNLEKAVEFAAEHGKGKIADEFKRLLWEAQIGVYATVPEGLDALAYRWGNYSSEFKQALMRIRASVIENTEAKRYALLDQTMVELLEAIKVKMEAYARSLSEPSVIMFYLGVLLPLILIIILPVGSTFSGAAMATPLVLFLIYCVAIPAVTLVFALYVIGTRPPTYTAPKIPDLYPGLPKKWSMQISNYQLDVRFVVVLIAIAGISLSYAIHAEGLPPKFLCPPNTVGSEECMQIIPYTPSEAEVLDRSGYAANYFEKDGVLYARYLAESKGADNPALEAEKLVARDKQIFFMSGTNDITPMFFIFGVLMTVAACAFVFLYYTTIYKRRAQEDIMKIEKEFKDSLYVIASRMGENKPIEEALKHVQEFLPNLKISQTIFRKTMENITLLGMPLQNAIFDPNYGALKDNPSSVIRSAMQLLVDSVQLGVNVAARTLMSLSMQLANAEKVNDNLKILVSEVTGMMRSMGTFIAPVVLGITTGLQKIVIVTIASISQNSTLQTSSASASVSIPGVPSTGFSSMPNFFSNTTVIGDLATPTQFVFIVAIYIIEIVLIMTFFVSKIEEDNDLLMRMNLARSLPIAILIFVVTMYVTNLLLGNFSFGG